MKYRHVALLRGINVGGNNIIKMVDLKSLFEELGFSDVSTYIQSGNVIFSSAESNLARLSRKIERALGKRFVYKACVAIVSQSTLTSVVKQAPKGFGKAPSKYRYDVIFFKAPATPKAAIGDIAVREGVDAVAAGKHAVYASRLIARASQSRISKIVSHPLYKSMTIRNWNTITKLLSLMKHV